MKIHTIVLGEYGTPPTTFCLYQFRTPLTPPLTSPPTSSVRHSMDKYSNNIDFFCIKDLTTLFFHSISHLNDLLLQLYREHSSYFCKDSTGKSYLMATAVAELATKLHMPLLADLCRQDQQHWSTETTQSLLKSIPGLHPQSPVVVETMFAPMRLDGHESFFVSRHLGAKMIEVQSPVIRLSPPSDPHLKPRELPFNPTVESRLSSSPAALSSSASTSTSKSTLSQSDHPTKRRHLALQDTEEHPSSSVFSNTLPKPSNLLLKRLAPKHGQKAPNLMIFTPSYDQTNTAIHSAPLRAHPTTPHHLLTEQRKRKLTQKTPPHPSTAAASTAPWPQQQSSAIGADFPSPPIVPSQQPPTPQPQVQSQSQSQPQSQSQQQPPTQPSTARLLHPASARLRPTIGTPSTATSMSYPSTKLTAKQQFLQPFELLHDTLEQTKVLKTTLDDQIRRSATLLQGLPSASTVESLVRRQVQDYYQTISFKDQVEECRERVMALEQRVRSSPLKEVIAEREERIEPSESMFELMKRLDYLEQKIDQRQA